MWNFIEDYNKLVCEPQLEWIKKHWKVYLCMIGVSVGVTCMTFYKDDIKYWIRNKFRQEKES